MPAGIIPVSSRLEMQFADYFSSIQLCHAFSIITKQKNSRAKLIEDARIRGFRCSTLRERSGTGVDLVKYARPKGE